MYTEIRNYVQYPGANLRHSLFNILSCNDLRISDKTVYTYLLSHAGDGLNPFPSYRELASELLLSEGELRRCIKTLEEKLFLTIEQKTVPGGIGNVHTLSEFLF